MNTTIPTSHGNLTPEQIVSECIYNSYATCRDEGLSHKLIVAAGVGNEACRIRYENEKSIINN
jgi:hypothetical protein